MSTKPQVLLYLLLCLLTEQVSAQIYRCIGQNSEVLFQAARCSSGKQSSLSVKSTYQPSSGLRPSETRWLELRKKQRRKIKKPHKPRLKKTDFKKQDEKCWKKQQQLDRVKMKLRQGYKPVQGDRLRKKRRSYEDYLSRFCG